MTPSTCPDCAIPLEPCPSASDPDARVCPRCGLDRLAVIMLTIAQGGMVWDHREASLVLRWKDGSPAPTELVAVKKLIPALRRIPHSQLALGLGSSGSWDVGTFPCVDARALFVRARELGLTPELSYLPETRGTSVDPGHEEDEEEN